MRTCQRHLAMRVGASAVHPAIIGFLILSIYSINVGYNLQLFYRRGAGDNSGWFAWLASNAHAWPMTNPDVIGGNFLSSHMSPIFFVTTALLQPLSDLPVAVRFCLLISLWAPILWLALFVLLDRFAAITFGQRCAASLLLTFSGIMLSMLGFPHIEMLIPALGLLAIAICLRAESASGWAGAGVIALLALTIREDAGMHLFLVLLAMASVSNWAGDRRTMWRLLGLAAFAITGSILALWVQRQGVPGGGQQLGNVYLGQPALAHVSVAGLARRLVYWCTRREYIFLPLLTLLIAASRCGLGDYRLLLGVALSLPWLALSLVAAAQQAGDLWSYYSFPLMFMLLWPLLLSQSGPPASRRLLLLQIVMGGLSTAAFVAVGLLPNVGDGGSHDKAPWTHLWPPSPTSIRLTEVSLAHRDGWLFDYGAAALVFGSLRPGQFRAGLAFDDADIRAAHGLVRFDTEPNFLAPQISALRQVFPICTSVGDTVLQICTRAP